MWKEAESQTLIMLESSAPAWESRGHAELWKHSKCLKVISLVVSLNSWTPHSQAPQDKPLKTIGKPSRKLGMPHPTILLYE